MTLKDAYRKQPETVKEALDMRALIIARGRRSGMYGSEKRLAYLLGFAEGGVAMLSRTEGLEITLEGT